MKIFTDKNAKRLIITNIIIMIIFQAAVFMLCRRFSLGLFMLSLGEIICVTASFMLYVKRQNAVIEEAAEKIRLYLAGNKDERIDCNDEGEMNKLFHAVNNMAAVLSAHAEKENGARVFLKDTISDISHQLKTPLSALNVYNALLQEEAGENASVREFAEASEKELDRIEELVQKLLKITRLDAGAVVFEKREENVGEMMNDIALHFAYRAKLEEKELKLSGDENISLICDKGWMEEALGNIIKNAFDHTGRGGKILILWRKYAGIVQITIKDDGCGIHPEDLHHIFKRFYRSRFSKDTRGVGLGLPLAKTIIEEHKGSVEVDSELGKGTIFTVKFLV